MILSIQRDEYGVAITAKDQPDLTDIPAFYQTGHGDFRVATDGDRIIGTIALKDIGAGHGALRKMFVAASHRGREAGVAQALLDGLLTDARDRGVQQIWLGTTDLFVAAHRFYERNGFAPVPVEALPIAFPRMAVDTRFYGRALA